MKPRLASPPALWRQRYEALRLHALQARQVLGADPLGLVVLVTRGVAGWMQGWRDPAGPPSPPSAPPLPARCPTTPPWQRELTEVLAHMTAQHL